MTVKKAFSYIALAMLMVPLSGAPAAGAAAWKPTNYVLFTTKGDCRQEDCIAAINEALKDQKKAIASMDLTPFAYHQTEEYKTLKIIFWDLKTAPFAEVMQNMAGLGYSVISYVIHDVHTGRDIIIPH